MIEDVNLSQGFYDGLSINHNVLNVSYSRCPFYFFACVPSNIQRAADTLRNEFLMQDYFKLHHKQLFACFNLGLSWRNPLWFSEKCLSQVFTSSALFLLGQKASFLPDKQDAAFWFHRHVRKVVTPSDRYRLNHQSVKFSQECGLKVQQIRTFVFKSRLPFQICFCTFFKINPRRWNVNVQVDPKEAPQRKKLLTKVKVLTGSQVERCIFSIRDSHSGNTNAERLHINTESVQSSADSRRQTARSWRWWVLVFHPSPSFAFLFPVFIQLGWKRRLFVSSSVFWCSGFQSSAGARPRHAAARHQRRPCGLGEAGPGNRTEGPDGETAPGPLGANSHRQHVHLRHRQHVSDAVDVQVRLLFISLHSLC